MKVSYEVKSKSGRYMTLKVPTVPVLCSWCKGIPSKWRPLDSCSGCNGTYVVPSVCERFIAKHPMIKQARVRYLKEVKADTYRDYDLEQTDI